MAARFDFLTSRKTSKTCLALISLKTHSRSQVAIPVRLSSGRTAISSIWASPYTIQKTVYAASRSSSPCKTRTVYAEETGFSSSLSNWALVHGMGKDLLSMARTSSGSPAVIGWVLWPDMSFFVACKFFTFRRPAAEIVIQEYYGAGASLFLVLREDYVPEVDFFEHVLPGDPEPRALYELTQA